MALSKLQRWLKRQGKAAPVKTNLNPLPVVVKRGLTWSYFKNAKKVKGG